MCAFPWLPDYFWHWLVEMKSEVFLMYKTFEAIYEDGRITPLQDMPCDKRLRVLITFLDELDPVSQSGKDLLPFIGVLRPSDVDPLQFQRKIRDEW